MLDKTYRPDAVEAERYREWEEAGCFRRGRRPDATPYTIVIPPPNVTGNLHIGHALNNTLQDTLIRWRRMSGDDVLWQPGTDHAGIATQMVVERELAKQGNQGRRELGRERFLEKVWEWKAQSGGAIVNQLKRLGASCDWSRERFTMDEGLSAAVRRIFVALHKDGLIYRDKRLVNWDPKFETAISDLEVVQTEVKGKLWYFRYPVEGETDVFITVATTRPETMLGDTAVAVHPDDERYTALVGRMVRLPITGRLIPIVADAYADKEVGSGAVKITPAHDFNDFEVGKRHDLPLINVFDTQARIKGSPFDDFTFGHRAIETGDDDVNIQLADGDGVVGPATSDLIPERYHGLDRFAAREKVVAEIEALGLLEKIEDHLHTVPYGDRSNVAIEPYLTDQWFCDVSGLAKASMDAVNDGRTKFVPENGKAIFFQWMENIQPWCVSRQLWWGHRIPAWYGPDGQVFVELTAEEAQKAADAHYGKPVELTQEEDVLDTWFSSALWPFSTLGWPDANDPALARHYKNDVLVTGWDILFFWVARMMMFGLYAMKEVPFHTVYLHGLIRDAQGQKMSKSKGNVMDPLDIVDEYGADALRFTLAQLCVSGRDIKISKDRVAISRNFMTKLWNAARFCEINGCVPVAGFDPASATLTVNRWILGVTVAAEREALAALEGYRFNDYANTLWRFVWDRFCDWYVELAKPVLQGEDGPDKVETQAMTAWVLGRILGLMHPVTPFITEQLWQDLGYRALAGGAMLIDGPFPADPAALADGDAAAEMDWVIGAITEIRSVRSQMNVPAGAQIPALLIGGDARTAEWAARHAGLILRLARLSAFELADEAPKGAVQCVTQGSVIALPLADIIDLDAEQARLTKEIAKAIAEIEKIDRKLGNADFLARAPDDVVEEQRERRAGYAAEQEAFTAALERLKAL